MRAEKLTYRVDSQQHGQMVSTSWCIFWQQWYPTAIYRSALSQSEFLRPIRTMNQSRIYKSDMFHMKKHVERTIKIIGKRHDWLWVYW